MSESGEKNKSVVPDSEKPSDAEKQEGIKLDLDFAPSWARTSPEEHLKSVKNNRYEGDGGSYNRRDNRRPGQRDGWRADGHNDKFSRGGRGDAKRGGGSDRRPQRRGDQPPQDRYRKPRRDNAGAAARGTGAPQGGAPYSNHGGRSNNRGGYRPYPHPRVEHPPLPIEIRVLPEQKALGGVIRRIQSSHKAFPLRDIAWLFLDKPASCLIRIAQQNEDTIPLFQCKVCGIPALGEEEIQNHLINRHLDEFFDVEEIECEPPGGQFVCVMRCGITGKLLGPPNHHSFNSRVQDMLRTKFPNMSEEAYRRKIESVREPEAIEEWRQSCTRKFIYRRKVAEVIPPPVEVKVSPEPEAASTAADGEIPAGEAASPAPVEELADVNEVKAPPMEREVAELVFKREMMPRQYASVKHLVCIASTALQTPSKRLYFAIKDTIHKERRFPTSLFYALRGAFRHRKLFLFRANEPKGPDFVMQKKPSELDPSHAVDLVKELIAYIRENPASTKAELVHALAGKDEAKIKEILGQLAWLIEKGNVIEYYNDVLSAPLEFPAFKLLPGEKKRGKRSESVAAAAVAGGDKPGEGKAETESPDSKKADEKSSSSVSSAPVEGRKAPESVPEPEPEAAENSSEK